jgi:ABC-type multidrug transport system fused ATPase/permease subunit
MGALAYYVHSYLAVFGLISALSIIAHVFSFSLWTWGSVRASRVVHTKLLSSLLAGTFRHELRRGHICRALTSCLPRWMDSTPTSRILQRMTQDIQTFDGSVALNVNWFLDSLIGLSQKIGFIVLFAPVFLLPAVLITVAGLAIGNTYLRAQMSVKREVSRLSHPPCALLRAVHVQMAVTKAPVLNVISGVLGGLGTIV